MDLSEIERFFIIRCDRMADLFRLVCQLHSEGGALIAQIDELRQQATPAESLKRLFENTQQRIDSFDGFNKIGRTFGDVGVSNNSARIYHHQWVSGYPLISNFETMFVHQNRFAGIGLEELPRKM